MLQLQIFSALDELSPGQAVQIQNVAVLSPDGGRMTQRLLGRLLQAGMVGLGVPAETPRDHNFLIQPLFLDRGPVLLTGDPLFFLAIPQNIFRHLLIIPAQADGLLPVFHQEPGDLFIVSQSKDLPHRLQGDVQLSACGNDIQLPQVSEGVVAVLVVGVDMVGHEQANLVIEMQGIL